MQRRGCGSPVVRPNPELPPPDPGQAIRTGDFPSPPIAEQPPGMTTAAVPPTIACGTLPLRPVGFPATGDGHCERVDDDEQPVPPSDANY
jgi:hypothetical protein